MAIEKHMLQTHSLFEKAGEVLEGVAELKKRLSSIQSDKMQLEDDNALLRRNNAELKAENRRLKRALWLARAISAINAVGEIHNVIVCMRERNPKMSLSNTEAQEQVWKNVARKCRAKAEQYMEEK